MKYYFKKRESLPGGIDRIIRLLLDNSYKLLIKNDVVPDDSIHEVRKSVKKLRALLRLIAPAMKGKTFRKNNRALRDFSRSWGRARDSATLLASLDYIKLHYSPFLHEAATAPVYDELARRHETALQQHLENSQTTDLEDQLQSIATQLAVLDTCDFSLGTVFTGLKSSYRKGRHALQALHVSPTTENGHELRKQAKTLWYQLRLLHKWSPAALNPAIKQLRTLGELLGQDHDLAMLIVTLGNLTSTSDSPTRMELITGLAETRRIALLSQALQIADQVYARKPGKFMAWFKEIQRVSCV